MTDGSETAGNKEPQTINIVVVGDTYVGKSCLIYSYASSEFETVYTPTVLDQYRMQDVVRSR